MPFPGEHAARLIGPDRFDEFRRRNEAFGPGIDAIFGLTGTRGRMKSELQSIRFDSSRFTVEQARKWLEDHDFKPILFEPAEEGSGHEEDEEENESRSADNNLRVVGNVDLAHTPRCFASYMGFYLMEPTILQQTISAIRQGILQPKAQAEGSEGPGFEITGGGIAIIAINGFLQKGLSKFGGTSTIEARRTIRAAVDDPDVNGILLAIDSPGGMLAGTNELAAEIRNVRTAKAVRAHIDDLGASAAFWIASQTEFITANETAQIGSIGTLVVVEDSSKAAEMAGITVHVISTGSHKGAFVPGAPVLDSHLAEEQEIVDGLNAHFLRAVQRGRGMTRAELRSISDGRVFISEKALELKLIDKIQSFEGAILSFSHDLKRREKSEGTSPRRSRARIALAKAKK